MPVRPNPGDIVVKGLDWQTQSFIGTCIVFPCPEFVPVSLTLCGPKGGYSFVARMTPEKAKEMAAALIAKASEAEEIYANRTSGE